MPSVFGTDEGPCSIFGGAIPWGGGTVYALSWARAVHLHYGTPPAQDARGEVRLSFIGIGTIPLEMQPLDRMVNREVHGIVVQVAWLGISQGGSSGLRELDRTMILGQQIEVVQVSPYGDHDEIICKEIGR